MGINLPEAMSEEVERAAKTENRTPDAFVQEAIERALLLKRHRALQDFGNGLAAKQGIAEADVPRLVKESRRVTAGHRR